MDGVQSLPLFGIISDHFKQAVHEQDISLGDFRKMTPEIKGSVFVDISTFLRGGQQHITDVVLKSKVR